MLFLDFLWFASAVEVILDSNVPHMFLATFAAWNAAELVIVITVVFSTFSFNAVQALADHGPNLVSWSTIITIWLKWIDGIWLAFGGGW